MYQVDHKVDILKGYHLSIKGIRKRYLFCQKGVEPPCVASSYRTLLSIPPPSRPAPGDVSSQAICSLVNPPRKIDRKPILFFDCYPLQTKVTYGNDVNYDYNLNLNHPTYEVTKKQTCN